MLNFEQLTVFDFQVINTVYEYQPVSMSDLKELLPEQQALDLRVEILSTWDKKTTFQGLPVYVNNTAYISHNKETDMLTITQLGIKAVEDWRLINKRKADKTWEYRFWNALAITFSLIALLKSFWPDIVNLLQTPQ